MLHRLITGLILAALLWYAMGLIGVDRNAALAVAALPILAALLNLLTPPVFSLSAVAGVGIVFFVLFLDEPTKAQITAQLHRLAEPR